MDAAGLVVAAGRGTRFANDSAAPAKQYQTLGGKPVLAWSLEALAGHARVKRLQVVIHADDHALYEQVITALPALLQAKLAPPVEGGATRQISVHQGLTALNAGPGPTPKTVLIHDAARPFLRQATITAVLDALDEHPGAAPSLPIPDTLKLQSANAIILKGVSRDNLMRIQTPQGFRFSDILAAHDTLAPGNDAQLTDDTSVLDAAGGRVKLVEGDENLRKITTPRDLAWARRHVLETSMFETRTGQGYDVHALVEGDRVTLCGVEIPFSQRLSGHSDADVAMHALTDAILGAIGDGDIGTHFPPSDPKWKGAASRLFLTDAMERVRARGGHLINADLTLICEAPRIGPHRAAMIDALATILSVEPDRLSVKATTTEGLGYCGRREGIAALASVSIAMPTGIPA